MEIYKLVWNAYIFLIKLKMQIKFLTDEKFDELIKEKDLDYTQKIYLIYFRYM